MPAFRKASGGQQGKCVVVVSGQTGMGNKVLFIKAERLLSPVRLPKVQRKVHEALNDLPVFAFELPRARECVKRLLVPILTGEGHAKIRPRACPLVIDRDCAANLCLAGNDIALIEPADTQVEQTLQIVGVQIEGALIARGTFAQLLLQQKNSCEMTERFTCT